MTTKESGVYLIWCDKNGREYVGSGKSIMGRIYDHFWKLRHNCHRNKHIQRVFNKYGEKSFHWKVLETCPTERTVLLEREQFHIDQRKPQMNIYKIAGSPSGRKMSPEQKAKISAGLKVRHYHHSLETRKKIGESQKGKVISQASIEKMRRTKTGKKQSEESVAKRAKEFLVIAPDGSLIRAKNKKRFCQDHGLTRALLNDVLNGRRSHHHGFRRYIERGEKA